MNLVRSFHPNRRKKKGEGGASPGGSESPQTPAAQQQQSRARSGGPTLDRCNATKNMKCDAWVADSDESALGKWRLTRSLDVLPAASPASVLPPLRFASHTSFRISGEEEGEFDALCRSLGLSGPDDFAITPADWAVFGSQGPCGDRTDGGAAEAKDRSTPPLEGAPPPPSPPPSPPPPPLPLPQEGQQEGGEEENGFGAVPDGFYFGVETVKKTLFPMSVRSRVNGRGGIKGARPSLLAPPPLMSLPATNKVTTTWDIVKSLAPDDEREDGGAAVWRRGNSPEPEDDKAAEEEDNGDLLGENAEIEDGKGLRMGVTSMDLAASCSFWTSNDDDSSSTTTEGAYVISPVGKLRRNIGSWTKGQLLGSGSFGSVYEAMSDDGFFFAVKEVPLLDEGTNAQQCIHQLEQEIALLSQFEHENIVQYLGTAKVEAKLCIFLELVSQGSLVYLYQKYHLRDSQVSAYTRQILNGLKYLHDRNVVHRDIKCANILVDTNGSVKLADFGLAKEMTKLNDVKSCKGSVYWMAPEVVKPRRTYGPSADIWSLGCTVLEMLTRQHPFPDLEWTQAIFLIGRGGGPPIPDSLSRDARNFIEQCTQVDPDKRPSASKLLDHPFVKRMLPTSGSDSSTHDSDGRTWLQM